jgi:LacI family transcriptional regulator
MSRSRTPRFRKSGRLRVALPGRIPHILLLIETSYAFGRGIVEGIARYALENGPWSIQFEPRGLGVMPPSWLKRWSGDGIISRTVNLKSARLLRATHLPLIELLGSPAIGSAQVQSDVSLMARMIAEHFINNGLRQFAYFIPEEVDYLKPHREAFGKVLGERGYCYHCYDPPIGKQILPHWNERHRPRLIKWLRSLPRPIGICVSGDSHALPLLNVCRELDIAVPEEMAIVGIGNDLLVCETVRPTLTSLDLDARRIGYEAARLLDRKMAGEKADEIISLPPSQLVVRQSTNLMLIEDPDVVHAMRMIRDFACKGLTVSSLADKVGLSLSVLERRFRQYLKRTPKEEILRLQIEYAKTLLVQTDRTGKDIAFRSGFHTPQYFNNAFAREVDMTPNAYRRMHRVPRDFA